MIEGIETRLPNGMFVIEHPELEKPRQLTAQEKITFECKQHLLHEKASVRQERCWRYDCERAAATWVVEVGFDFKGEKAAPLEHVTISSANYTGPVPGFCTFCLSSGPQELAQTVLEQRPEVRMGVRPKRWFVSFTDGMRQGGEVMSL